MDHSQSKEELEREIKQRNLAALNKGDSLGALLVFNLENFAHRYLETKKMKDIKCQYFEKTYWVESIEDDIFTALKWDNRELKEKLIDLCKKYPGQESKNIKIKLRLGTTLVGDDKVKCFSSINWDFPNFTNKENEISCVQDFDYSDLLELRNKHAALLEKVAEIF